MPSEIIVENTGLIHSLSKRFYGVEREDLLQAGYLGLTKAYRAYNPEMETKFSTYAYGYIYGEMYEAATGNRPIKVRKPEIKLYKGVIKTKALLEEKYNRPVSYEETCSFLHVNYDTFLSVMNSMTAMVSLEDVDYDVAKRDNTDDLLMLKESLDSLTELEKSVIERRYMEDMSQDETAKVLGLSQVKVSRIEKKSREKMKNFCSS